MARNKQRLINLHTSTANNKPAGQLLLGEIAVEHSSVKEAKLYVATANEGTETQIATFITGEKVQELIDAGSAGLTAVSAQTVANASAIAAHQTAYEGLVGEVEAIKAWPASGITAAQVTAWDAAKEKAHEHNNKDVLDGIDSDDIAAWDEAAASAHNHTNKTVLDGIDATKVAAWNAAEQNAKNYADGLNTAMDGRVGALEAISGNSHTHTNKSVLDTIGSADVANWNTAYASAHTHENKSLLDTYTQTEANLADAVSKKHEHSNKDLLDSYTAANADILDAISKEHVHDNKTVLDSITSVKVAAWDAAEANAVTSAASMDSQVKTDIIGDMTGDTKTLGALQDEIESLDSDLAVTMTTGGTVESILKSYTFKQGDNTIGTVDIPKDLVIKSGSVVEKSGKKYLELVLSNDEVIDIDVEDLCDVYAGDDETIEISTGNVISVKANKFELSGAAADVKDYIQTNYATSANTHGAIEAVDAKFDDYATSAETEDAIAAAIAAETARTETVYAKADHDHEISDVTGLQNALDGKAGTGHTHGIPDVSGLQDALDSKSNTAHTHDDRYYTETEVDNLLANKSDTGHTHAISEVSGLQDALDAKATAATTLAGYGITDAYTSAQTDSAIATAIASESARTETAYAKKATTLAGYGIEDAYTKTVADSTFAAKDHDHAAADITDFATEVAKVKVNSAATADSLTGSITKSQVSDFGDYLSASTKYVANAVQSDGDSACTTTLTIKQAGSEDSTITIKHDYVIDCGTY